MAHKSGIFFRTFSVIAVSSYLLLVLLFLLMSRRIRPSLSLRRIIAAKFRSPVGGYLSEISPEQGHCYLAPLPSQLISDKEGYSTLALFENDKPLPISHSAHDDIRSLGAGRFSHWGNYVYFSTLDNSNPQLNGRVYSFKEVRSR